MAINAAHSDPEALANAYHQAFAALDKELDPLPHEGPGGDDLQDGPAKSGPLVPLSAADGQVPAAAKGLLGR